MRFDRFLIEISTFMDNFRESKCQTPVSQAETNNGKEKFCTKKNKPLNILTTHLKSGSSNLVCIAVVRTLVYNLEFDT